MGIHILVKWYLNTETACWSYVLPFCSTRSLIPYWWVHAKRDVTPLLMQWSFFFFLHTPNDMNFRDWCDIDINWNAPADGHAEQGTVRTTANCFTAKRSSLMESWTFAVLSHEFVGRPPARARPAVVAVCSTGPLAAQPPRGLSERRAALRFCLWFCRRLSAAGFVYG